jgi:hypothetical protein
MFGERDKYYEETRRFLSLLHKHFWRLHPKYDVIVFHSASFDNATLAKLQGTVPAMPVTFAPVEIPDPGSHAEEFKALRAQGKLLGTSCWPQGVPWDYLSMGRFFSKLFFAERILAPYDYVWRLDGNLYFDHDVTCDPFEVMVKSRAVFGFYSWRNTERPGCQGNLREKAFAYAEEHGFTPAHLESLGRETGRTLVTHYSGGWGVFKWSFFGRSEDLRAFADYVDDTGITFYNRVGEQVFYANALGLFVPREALHQYGGIGPFIHRTEYMWGPRSPASENVKNSDPYCEKR